MKHFLSADHDVEKILLSCYVAPGAGDRIHRDRPGHGLALHLDGEREYVFSTGMRLRVRRGDVIYLPRGSTYSVVTCSPGACYAINFLLRGEKNTAPFVFATRHMSEYLESFRRAERLWRSKSDAYVMGCKAELYRILCLMQREWGLLYMTEDKRERIRPAAERIHECYDREMLSVSELAGMCGITPEYFRRLFHAVYGTSPVKYIQGLRIARACELINSGLYTVSEAALMSGFTDMSHFSRTFKQATGVPPSAYPKQ